MSTLLMICVFSFVMSISPGPVNMITLSTGMNHGEKQAMPFVLGATLGFSLLLLVIGLGLGTFIEQFSFLLDTLCILGSLFIIYLGFKLMTSSGQLTFEKVARPSFNEGFLLQWLNPKAWIACLAGVSVFKLSPNDPLLYVFILLYFCICYLSIMSWAVAGSRLSFYVKSHKLINIFNQILGGGLMLVAVYLAYSQMI
ncbi:LysE family translocator [Shewanella surugensis]|uniref:LysE family translocator n=1 Tax=Shewanella surugensis TaxID=212020 RepID=A0ABT0L6D3_9GAMM|nr:LysE family translocator [Shewanella surugensis]MCL1123248.1 LysE family translocator [Shewanella surugensis]